MCGLATLRLEGGVLVAAPRALADPEHAGILPLGFLVYVVSALLGIGWLAAGTAR